MRLVIAADIFPPESGGPATYCVTLANELTKLGVEVVVVSLNPNSDVSKVTCPIYKVSANFKLLRYWQYYCLLKKYGQSADVIYAMGPVNAGYPALKVSQRLKKKFVVKVVGDYAWEQFQTAAVGSRQSDFVSVEDFQNQNIGGKIGWLKKIERQVVQAADAVIVPAEYLRTLVIGWGGDVRKVQTILNAVDFRGVPLMAKPAGEKWIVSVGRLVKWKGMETLIAVVPEILKAFPAARLKIVGHGPEYRNLESRILNLGLTDKVELMGNLARDKTLGVIRAADVFILNSGYEGRSHVILEAQSFSVPVLASNSGGNKELVSGTHLFEYNNKDQIIKLLIRELANKADDENMEVELRKLEGAAFGAQTRVEDMIDKTLIRLESVCAS